MKNILAIHTGGTISMSQDEKGGVVQNDENPIDNNDILGLSDINVINDDFYDYCNACYVYWIY